MIYKIVLDIQEADIDGVINSLLKTNTDVCLDEDCIYVYSHDNHQHRELLNSMRKNNIKNYFIQEIKKATSEVPTKFSESWLIEKFNQDKKIKAEEEQQKQLQEMMDRIETAKQCFLNIKKEAIQKYNSVNKS